MGQFTNKIYCHFYSADFLEAGLEGSQKNVPPKKEPLFNVTLPTKSYRKTLIVCGLTSGYRQKLPPEIETFKVKIDTKSYTLNNVFHLSFGRRIRRNDVAGLSHGILSDELEIERLRSCSADQQPTLYSPTTLVSWFLSEFLFS